MTLVDGHNDIVMAFFMLLALYLLTTKHYTFSILTLSLSIATKYITIIFLPLFLIYIYGSSANTRSKVFFTLKTLVLNSLLFFFIFNLFDLDLLNLSSSIQTLKLRLDTNSFPYITYTFLNTLSIPPKIPVFRMLSDYAFLLFCGGTYCYYFFKQKKSVINIINISVLIYIAYFLIASFQFGSWYLVWILPLLLLSTFPKKNILFLLLSLAALVSFWKRISFLLIAISMVYAAYCFLSTKIELPKLLRNAQD